ncbi:MAG TPA: hypothetical protein DCY12_02085 [Candidatus Atribacteria bacterium]|nr:hypothetical protein [Candidatus Atribacteria bacterium]
MNDSKTILLVSLIASQIIGDFLFQPDAMAKKKAKLSILLLHSLILALISYILCGVWNNWDIPLFIFITHLIIDSLKQSFDKNNMLAFFADQVFHFLVIFFISFIISPSLSPNQFYWWSLWGDNELGILIILAGFVVTTKVCELLIGFFLTPFNGQIKKENRGFKDGGRIIGILERAIIFLLIFINQTTGIGFLITAKTIFRFGEIRIAKNRREVEYILIGTFLSFSLGIFITVMTMIISQHFFKNFTFKLLYP